ncbi:transcription factor-like 5 protein [Mugil cephalus]|uniref:transcription factor-like 5 protein n=1 Tax=Mugil cephalus TaxID=48193 RepID=UPI001FB636E8|nr:transcription factor-like 5 protein [Mugil cephalus]
MSSFSSVYKTPQPREHSRDPVGLILSQGRCLTLDQGQTLDPELGLMESTEVEYAHLQHFLQAHMETQAGPPDWPDARPHPPAAEMAKDALVSTVTSPSTTTQAIDLSTSSDDHCLVVAGEKTPPSYGEIPGFVLSRIRYEESPAEPPAKASTSPKRSRSAARVCLEKRFNTMSADASRQQDIQSAVLTNFLTILQQSAEAQDATIHPPKQKWIKADRANPFEVPSSYLSGVYDPVTNMCGKVIAHVVEPAKHQALILPSFSFNFHPEAGAMKVNCTSSSNPAEEHQLVNTGKVGTTAASRNQCSTHCSQPAKAAKAAPDSARESQSRARIRPQSCMTLSQRKERHNSKERERRKRIRWCCDELNTMVPFCDSDTDKVTTLQWTTAFLRYINKTYGETFKEEFQKVFIHEKGHILKSSFSSGQDLISKEIDMTLTLPLPAEQ